MPNYKIQIDYTSNINKAAKVKLIDPSGNIILKADAVLPEFFHTKDEKIVLNLELKRYLPENYSSHNRYTSHYDACKERVLNILGNHYIESKDNLNSDKLTIAREHLNRLDKNYYLSDKEKIIKGEPKIITLSHDAFLTLEEILSNKNNKVEFESNKKWMLFGQKKCERKHTGDFDYLKDLGVKIANEEKVVAEQERIRQETETLRKAELEAALRQKKVDVTKPAKQKTIQQNETKTSSNKSGQSFSSSNISRNNRDDYYRNNNGLDPFDLMYMTAFPEMAPFYRPTSGIAWMLYFNNQNNHDNLTTNPIKTINQINGFEDVQGCNLRLRGEHFYKIELYADTAKTQYLGTVDCHPEKGLTIKDNDGNTSVIKEMDNKPGFNVLIENNNSSKALIEVVQDRNNNLVGNWTIEQNNSMMVSSSMIIKDDLSLSSDTSKVINLDNVSTNKDLNLDKYFIHESSQESKSNFIFGSDNKFTSEIKSEVNLDSKHNASFENNSNLNNNYQSESKPGFISQPEPSFKNEVKYEPPPPPPPPPDNTYSFDSRDPYSNSSPGF